MNNMGRMCPGCKNIYAPSQLTCNHCRRLQDADIIDWSGKKLGNIPCLFDGLPVRDSMGHLITYMISCPCPKCSPSF